MLGDWRTAARAFGWTRTRFNRFLIRMALISAVLNILMLGGSFFMLLVYDEVLPSRSVPTLVGLLVMIVVVYIFQALLDLARARAMVHIGAMVDQALAGRVFRILVGHELRAGPMRDGLQPMRDLDQIRAFLSGAGPLALLDLPWMLLFLAILFMFHVALGLLATVGAMVLVALTLVADRVARVQTAQATSIVANRFELAESSRRNAEILHAHGMVGRAETRWNEIGDQLLAANDRSALLSGSMASVSKTFRMLLQSLVLATGAALVIGDQASGGIIIAGSILSSRALAPVDHCIANWKGFIAARQAWARLEGLLRQMPPDRDVMGLPAPRQTLVVDRLSAGPPGTQKLSIGNVSFTLTAGNVLGVIGPSGSGKTSLLRALLGVWQPLRGTVRLDGATMDQWSPDELGRYIGYLPQDVELFDGTVAQNISRFDPQASRQAMLAAAKATDVHDLIVRLPAGYDSPLGPNGSNLSAGQRQRIGLARALYGDPFLIVLDEPNSNLDSEGERALFEAIGAAAQRGAIVILVAHRPSALEATSHILCLADGQTRLFGKRDDVLAKLKPRQPVVAPADPPPTPRRRVPQAKGQEHV